MSNLQTITTLCGIALFLVSSCGPRRVEVQGPPAPPEHVLLFGSGLAAFHEGTPEGYQRAAAAFQKAEALEPGLCEYGLHRAEALMFLAQERKLNWEEFDSLRVEAAAIIEARAPSPACVPLESFVRRLRAVSWSADYQSSGPLPVFVQFQRRDPANDPMAMINRAIELDPDDPMNWLALWKINPLDPRNPLLRAEALGPELPVLQYEVGNFRMILEDYASAKQSFERALERNPRHFRSMIGLSYALGVVDPNTDVEPLYKKVIEIAPSFLEGPALLGNYYAGIEETEQAVEQYQAAIALNARYDPAYLAMGVTLMRAGRMAEAETAFLKVAELRPTIADVYYYLGNIQLIAGNLAQAKARYQQSLRYRQNLAEAIYGLGTVAYREGQIDEALALYDWTIREKQDFADAYVSRGEIRLSRQQSVEAVRDFDQSLQIYEKQIAQKETAAQTAESQSRLRKALAERLEKNRLENRMQQVREVRRRAGEN